MTLKWHGYAALALAIVAGASPVHAQKMYWTAFGGIERANLDGSDREAIVRDTRSSGVAIDSVSRKIYWTDAATQSIRRANLDGSQIEPLITTGLDGPSGIALDLARSKMYWANHNARRIQRANLDGTSVEDVVVTELRPSTIRLDLDADKVYWSSRFSARLWRANLDGTGVEDVATDASLPISSFALDVANGRIYYTTALLSIVVGLPGTVQRVNFDGSGAEDLVDTGGDTIPWGIALDVSAGKMYWVEFGARRIKRANLDGSGVEILVEGGVQPKDLALGPAGDAIPAVSVWGLVAMVLLLLTMTRVSSLRRLRSEEAWRASPTPAMRCKNGDHHDT